MNNTCQPASIRQLYTTLYRYSLLLAFSLIACTAEEPVTDAGADAEASAVPAEHTRINKVTVERVNDKLIYIHIDYFYDGNTGMTAHGTLEMLPPDGKSDVQLIKKLVLTKGPGIRKVRVERPMGEVEEFRTDRIIITLNDRSEQTVLLREVYDIPIVWESTLVEQSGELLDYWAAQANSALMGGYYQTLNRMFDKWLNPEVTAQQGTWRLAAMLRLIDAAAGQRRWEAAYRHIEEWKQHSPGTAPPAIIEALYWVDYAWHARGSGYAGSVTETGRQLFRERLQKAEKVLLESKTYAEENPLWYYVYLRTALGLGWDKAAILELFIEAISKEPAFYPNYYVTANAVSPKWGGNYQLMDQVARTAADYTLKTDGDIAYTKVYRSIDENLPSSTDFFEDTLVEWPRMKQGFEQLLARYPDNAWYLQNYASFACRAGDGDSYLRLRSRFELWQADSRVWKSGHSPDTCDYMYMKRS